MRALTVRQPWASLIIGGLKDVENRTWAWHMPTRAPGEVIPQRLAIHAGKRHDGNEFRKALIHATSLTGEGEPGNTMEWIRGWWANRDGIGGYGALIGTVLVTGCHHADECRRTRQSDPYVDATRRIVHCSPWAEPDVYHWTLADPVELDEPIPMRGRQGLWNVPDDALAEVPA